MISGDGVEPLHLLIHLNHRLFMVPLCSRHLRIQLRYAQRSIVGGPRLWLNSALSPQLPPGPAQIVTLSLQSLYRSRWRNLVNKNCTTKSNMSATHNASTLCPVEEAFPTVRPRRRIRVLLADSSPGFRTVVAALLASEDSLEIVGRVGSANEIMEASAALGPDLLLINLGPVTFVGLTITALVSGAFPQINISPDGGLRFTATPCEIPNFRGAVFHLQAQLQPGTCTSTSDCELATKWL
jgi:hypothetical protein